LEAEGFAPDDIPIIAQAFDQVLRVKRLVDRKDPAVLMIARLTIQIAMTGERDPAVRRFSTNYRSNGSSYASPMSGSIPPSRSAAFF
jgi:hypothetical protein